METVEKSIVVDAPIETVYERWTRFEDFPKFMTSLREVRRLDDKQFYWRGERGGVEYESVSEITLQIPTRRVAWRSVSGAENSGVASFEPEADGKTAILLEMKYEPDSGWQDPVALAERLASHLENFKKLIEGSIVEEWVEHNWQGF